MADWFRASPTFYHTKAGAQFLGSSKDCAPALFVGLGVNNDISSALPQGIDERVNLMSLPKVKWSESWMRIMSSQPSGLPTRQSRLWHLRKTNALFSLRCRKPPKNRRFSARHFIVPQGWCGHGDLNPNASLHRNLRVMSPQWRKYKSDILTRWALFLAIN